MGCGTSSMTMIRLSRYLRRRTFVKELSSVMARLRCVCRHQRAGISHHAKHHDQRWLCSSASRTIRILRRIRVGLCCTNQAWDLRWAFCQREC